MGTIEQDFQNPPNDAKPWCYWWWLNGAASKEGITRDFEEMKSKASAGVAVDLGRQDPKLHAVRNS